MIAAVGLLGNPNKAKQELGWNPSKTSFEELVKRMVYNDMKKIQRNEEKRIFVKKKR